MTTPATTPATPRAGGIIGTTAWTGGKATPLTTTEPTTPLCFHPVEFTPNLKIYTACTMGSDIKFTGDGDMDFSLHNFEDAVEAHFVHTGMDSVFFLLDPMDRIEKSLIKNHGQFTMTQVQDHVMQLIARGDK